MKIPTPNNASVINLSTPRPRLSGRGFFTGFLIPVFSRYDPAMYPIDLPARLILLPGLGANHKLFAYQKRVFRQSVETPDLIAPASPHESLRSYALRFAEQLRSEPGDDRPLIVGGVSLGGMVALEMAEAVGAKAVVLISSCRRDRAVPLRTRIAELLGRPVPTSITPKVLTALSLPFALVNELDDDGFAILKEMAGEVDPAVLKWGGGAVTDWEHDGRWPVPIHQIHGAHDKIIPPIGDEDRLIPDGGHLIVITHDLAVNQYLVEVAEQYAGAPATPML
jgi:pimeloyl-ACP methyl ester carboxylesterase